MKFLKKRGNAYIIAVMAVVFSILFGSARSAGAEAQLVRAEFYSGNSCIYSQLRMKCSSAMNMRTISDSYGGSDLESAAEKLSSSRNALLALMETDAGASALYDANQELQSAAVIYYDLLSSRDDITAEDLGYLESDFSTFLNAERVIGESGYNDEVRNYDRTVLGFFPLSILKTFIDTPELFL